MIPPWVRDTSSDRLAGVVRLMLGVIFVMTGAMKLVVPALADAWSGQLLAANLPFYTLTRWTVPLVEIALGSMLLAGLLARLASVAVIGIMVVATYTHLVVDDPTLFPLQPSEPIIPIVVIVMSALILWKGAGAWSLDLKEIEVTANR
jgi:putative oxidoreductase